MSKTTRRTTRGFSITELLVAISIIGLLIGLAFPVIGVLNRTSRVEAGLNIVGMSADVARQWVQAESWANDGSLLPPTREKYSGTAAIYCPTGEIRITKNHRMAAVAANDFLEDRVPERNGYRDLSQVDYIVIPVGVGIAGIERFGPGTTDVRFIAPPFAIAFNELGQLNYGDVDGKIYYDANGNNFFNITQGRPAGYNPSNWSGEEGTTNEDPMASTLSRALPFEAIECVPGVVIYNSDDFKAEGLNFAGGGRATLDSAAGNWLKANGTTIFFSPHTGVALRDEQQE